MLSAGTCALWWIHAGLCALWKHRAFETQEGVKKPVNRLPASRTDFKSALHLLTVLSLMCPWVNTKQCVSVTQSSRSAALAIPSETHSACFIPLPCRVHHWHHHQWPLTSLRLVWSWSHLTVCLQARCPHRLRRFAGDLLQQWRLVWARLLLRSKRCDSGGDTDHELCGHLVDKVKDQVLHRVPFQLLGEYVCVIDFEFYWSLFLNGWSWSVLIFLWMQQKQSRLQRERTRSTQTGP